MKKIDWKNAGKKVGDFAVSVFELAFICGLVLPSRKNNVYVTKNYGSVTADYNGAVRAIVKSNMLDSYKTDVMEMLKRNGNAGYYEAVIDIVNGDMLDSYKTDMIEALSEE
jgi:hypothetical protein